MTGNNNKQRIMPTTTAMQSRLVIYQDTRRPKMVERHITTSWGRIRVKARLGQTHADVLEAICYAAERRKEMEDGSIKLLVDPARVRKLSQQDGTTLRRIIDDLQQAIIEIIEPRNMACQGQLVGHIDKAVRSDGSPITRYDPLTKGSRTIWSVTLGPVLVKLIESDLWLGYDPAPIAKLSHGVSQAIARHILTHKSQPNGGWALDALIQAVHGNASLSSVQMRNRRREIHLDAVPLREIGIEVNRDRVYHVKE